MKSYLRYIPPLAEIPQTELKTLIFKFHILCCLFTRNPNGKKYSAQSISNRFPHALIEVKTGAIILKGNMAIKFRRMRKRSHHLIQKYFFQEVFLWKLLYKDFFQEDAHNTLTCNLKSKKYLMIPTKETSQIHYSSTPLSTGNMFQDPWDA